MLTVSSRLVQYAIAAGIAAPSICIACWSDAERLYGVSSHLLYQVGDKALTAEGLDGLAKADADEQATDPAAASDARLIALLTGVWMAENAPAATPDAKPEDKPAPGPDSGAK